MASDFETPITPIDEPKRSRTGLIVGIIVLVIICCCCGTIAIFYFWIGDMIVDIFRGNFYQLDGLVHLPII
jgi:hypothetical protein